jgi:hypothetical protein
MPSTMKKLVDISVWILFIVGCLMLIFGIIASVRIGGPAVRVVYSVQFWGIGLFSIFLSVVAAWFRKVIG